MSPLDLAKQQSADMELRVEQLRKEQEELSLLLPKLKEAQEKFQKLAESLQDKDAKLAHHVQAIADQKMPDFDEREKVILPRVLTVLRQGDAYQTNQLFQLKQQIAQLKEEIERKKKLLQERAHLLAHERFNQGLTENNEKALEDTVRQVTTPVKKRRDTNG